MKSERASPVFRRAEPALPELPDLAELGRFVVVLGTNDASECFATRLIPTAHWANLIRGVVHDVFHAIVERSYGVAPVVRLDRCELGALEREVAASRARELAAQEQMRAGHVGAFILRGAPDRCDAGPALPSKLSAVREFVPPDAGLAPWAIIGTDGDMPLRAAEAVYATKSAAEAAAAAMRAEQTAFYASIPADRWTESPFTFAAVQLGTLEAAVRTRLDAWRGQFDALC